MFALQQNETWGLVILPKCETVIGYPWAYALVHPDNNSADSSKTRLVTKGIPGINYAET